MVLVDLSKEDLLNILESLDNGNWLDYDDDGTLHKLRDKVSNWLHQKNFVYFGGEMLSEEDGENFIAELGRKPTEKEVNYLKEAVEIGRQIPTFTGGYCYHCKKEGELDWYREICTDCFEKLS